MQEFFSKFIPQLDNIETSALLDSKTSFIDFKSRFHRTERIRTIHILRKIPGKVKNPRWREVRDCRAITYFARSLNTGNVKIISSSCKQRWCPTCAIAKAKFISAEIEDWLEAVDKPKLLTVTLKHSTDPLKNQIEKLYNAFKLLRRWKNFKKQINGGIWFFQVHQSKDDTGWHPHIHCLITGNYLQKEWISEAWQKITEDSFIIDIRQINNPSEAAKYVARYCARPAMLSDLSDEHAIEVIEALHGKRLCGKFGIASMVALKPEKPEDSGDWHNIGSWFNIVQKPANIEIAREILEAWIKDKTIGPHVDMRRFVQNELIQNGERLPDLSLEDLGIPITGGFI